MALPLFLTDRAHRDIDSICDWWSENHSAEQTKTWYENLVMAIDSLSGDPHRFAHVVENSQLPIEVHQVNFGSKNKLTHRIVYTIRPDMILVLRVLNLAQRDLTTDDL